MTARSIPGNSRAAAPSRTREPSTEASRRAFVLRNYTALRTQVDGLPDVADPHGQAPLGARWSDRWDYLERGADAAGDAGRALIARVIEAEHALSTVCVRFIHTPAAAADRPAARQYLFAAFGRCEAAWRAAAVGDMVLAAASSAVAPAVAA